MEFAADIFEILKEDFGLGLSAILLVAIWKLVRYIGNEHKDRVKDQRAAIALLEGVRNWLESNERAFSRFAEKLEQQSVKLERLTSRVDVLSEKLE